MTTPRELVNPFLRQLFLRVRELEQKMATVNTTPEDHGEQSAARMTEFELLARLVRQKSGKVIERWEPAFLEYLRRELSDPTPTRKDIAEKQFERIYADELEQIWRDAGII